MSIWDHVKPQASAAPTATSVELQPGGKVLNLAWADGKTTAVGARTLRQNCPCAGCVDEFTNVRTLDVEAVPKDIVIRAKHAVGNYAVSLVFSDGHQTGIFTWTFLREMSEKHPASSV